MTTGYLNTSYIKVYIEKTSNKIKHLFTGFPPKTGAGAGAGAGARVAGSEVEALRGKQIKRLNSYKKSSDFRLKRLTGAINIMAVGYKTTFCRKLFEKTQALMELTELAVPKGPSTASLRIIKYSNRGKSLRKWNVREYLISSANCLLYFLSSSGGTADFIKFYRTPISLTTQLSVSLLYAIAD